MKLDNRTIRLIAVGASISANCQPCLEANATWALENGCDEQEIAEAIQIGKMVRQGATSKMDEFILGLSRLGLSKAAATEAACDCDAGASRLCGGRNG